MTAALKVWWNRARMPYLAGGQLFSLAFTQPVVAKREPCRVNWERPYNGYSSRRKDPVCANLAQQYPAHIWDITKKEKANRVFFCGFFPPKFKFDVQSSNRCKDTYNFRFLFFPFEIKNLTFTQKKVEVYNGVMAILECHKNSILFFSFSKLL